MVQLSPSLTLAPPPDPCNGGGTLLECHMTSPKAELPAEHTDTYLGYENYIENGLICLKHKVRNLEKKKIKLDEYRLRLRRGERLNKDQMASVEKYEEVLHHLALAQELHQTLDSLTQNLLRSQKKAVKKEQMLRSEVERGRLSSVLQLQQVLQRLDRAPGLDSGLNQAPKVPVQTLQRLSQLRPLLGLTRDYTLSLDEQMDRAAGLYLDLLDAKDKPVVGSTFKVLKEELDVLLKSPYFHSLPPEPESCGADPADPADPRDARPADPRDPRDARPAQPGDSSDANSKTNLSKSSSKRLVPDSVLVQTWDSDFGPDREPPDQWDSPAQHEAPDLGKSWRGGAALVPKSQEKREGEGKRKKEKKPRREEHSTSAVDLQMEVLSLPTDSELRRQRLEELLSLTHGAFTFTFMQDSVLDGDSSPSRPPHRLRRRASGGPSPLAHGDPRSPLSKTLHSTPLPPRRLEPKVLTSSEPSPELQLPEPQSPALVSVRPPPSSSSPHHFTTPPSRRPIPSAHFNMHTVFKVNPTLPSTDFSKVVSELVGVSSISTQTPPEFAPPEDDMVYDYSTSFLSPSQSGGRPAPYQRPARGTPQSHLRDPGHFYAPGDEQNYRGSGHDNSAAWSDSSLGHSPERSTFALDSGQGESLTVSTLHSSGSDASLLPAATAPVLPHLPAPDSALSAPVLPLYPLPPQPLRVAFSASRTANFAPGNLDQPIVFDQLHSNHGDVYDPHIGRFTCPAPGTYVFLFHILKLAINVPLYVNLMRNQEVMVSAYANDGAPDHETASNHAILPLYQGDQVWLRLHRGAIYGSTWKYSTFSGFLLYPD
ncbi:caprin-2 [Periophthalmus magnuspinnatus]|uniref:caprin-2 n=1 Tax=Periophthalmus magnuspinnatus TaxID=409849 RepID=UPI0024362D67|nr:caprin-2 [Periophthalmus magnuspinnatus]